MVRRLFRIFGNSQACCSNCSLVDGRCVTNNSNCCNSRRFFFNSSDGSDIASIASDAINSAECLFRTAPRRKDTASSGESSPARSCNVVATRAQNRIGRIRGRGQQEQQREQQQQQQDDTIERDEFSGTQSDSNEPTWNSSSNSSTNVHPQQRHSPFSGFRDKNPWKRLVDDDDTTTTDDQQQQQQQQRQLKRSKRTILFPNIQLVSHRLFSSTSHDSSDNGQQKRFQNNEETTAMKRQPHGAIKRSSKKRRSSASISDKQRLQRRREADNNNSNNDMVLQDPPVTEVIGRQRSESIDSDVSSLPSLEMQKVEPQRRRIEYALEKEKGGMSSAMFLEGETMLRQLAWNGHKPGLQEEEDNNDNVVGDDDDDDDDRGGRNGGGDISDVMGLHRLKINNNTNNKKQPTCMILLMDPARKIFEIIRLKYQPEKTTVRDIIRRIKIEATDIRLAQQTYTGLAYNGMHITAETVPIDMLTEETEHTKNGGTKRTPLLAVPDTYKASDIQALASDLLLRPQVARLIGRSDAVSKKKNTKPKKKRRSSLSKHSTKIPHQPKSLLVVTDDDNDHVVASSESFNNNNKNKNNKMEQSPTKLNCPTPS